MGRQVWIPLIRATRPGKGSSGRRNGPCYWRHCRSDTHYLEDIELLFRFKGLNVKFPQIAILKVIYSTL